MKSKPTESESDLQEVPFEAVALVVEAGEVVLAKSSHFLVPPLFDDTQVVNGIPSKERGSSTVLV
jgi:hypothetical protein